jgi:hypothetical protein
MMLGVELKAEAQYFGRDKVQRMFSRASSFIQ